MSSVRDEIVKETEGLPEGLLRQVLQFIRFLRSGKESEEHLEEEVDEATRKRLVDQALRAEEDIANGRYSSIEEVRLRFDEKYGA